MPGVRLAWKRADDLLYSLGLQQRGQTRVAVAGVVVDDGELVGALRNQRIDELRGHAGRAEAADHHGRAIGNVCNRGCGRCNDLVDHELSYALAASPSKRVSRWQERICVRD